MSERERTDFQRLLAYHSAPAMLGIKPANLVCVEGDERAIRENAEEFNRRAGCKGLAIAELRRCRGRTLMLVYHRRLMERQLSAEDVRRMLGEFGYGGCKNCGSCLDKLCVRLGAAEDFPHEIGLFLGYPTEDVRGFIANRGANFKLSGYWKVYSDPVRAGRLFRSYDRCRSYLLKGLSQGEDLYSLLGAGKS